MSVARVDERQKVLLQTLGTRTPFVTETDVNVYIPADKAPGYPRVQHIVWRRHFRAFTWKISISQDILTVDNMHSSFRSPCLRWVTTVPAPQSRDHCPSPNARQMFYGAVELGETGNIVVVDDVVEISEQHDQRSTSSCDGNSRASQQHQPRLAQVGVLWFLWVAQRSGATYLPTVVSPLRTSPSMISVLTCC